MLAPIDLIKLQILHQLLRRTCGVHEANRVLIGIDGAQRGLDLRGDEA